MSRLRQLTQLAANSPEAWRVFLPAPATNPDVKPAEIPDAKERSEQTFRRARRLLGELADRLKTLRAESAGNPALRARLLVEAARKLETLDPKLLLAREEKAWYAHLARDYQTTFDALCLTLGEDGVQTLMDLIHFPERIFALGEFVKLRREKAGLDARGVGLEKKIEEAREESAVAEKESACVEAFLKTGKAQKWTLVAVGVVILAVVLLNLSQWGAAIVGVVGLILLMLAGFSWLANGIALAAFDEESKRQVSHFREDDFIALSRRLRKAQENRKALEARWAEHSQEIKAICEQLDRAADVERTWKPMTDLEAANAAQTMIDRCKMFFGDGGARVIFQYKRELSLW